MKKKNIGVIGVGYVGLTLAAVLAEKGFNVCGIDINEKLIEKLRKCEPHFYEKGLALILRKHVGKNLFFQKEVLERQDIYILSVGTPVNEKTKKPNLDYIKNSTKQIVDKIDDGNLVILRSTVPVGTTRNIIKPILDDSKKRYYLAFCPERTVEGRALEELKELPQIIGGIDEESIDFSFDLFKEVTPAVIRMSSLEAAEMVKLLCNSYRDINFAYSNEVALICEKIGIDPIEVIISANKGYERSKIPMPGFVGGACLEKDPYILTECVSKSGYSPKIITKGREINEYIIDYVYNKIREGITQEKKIFISGVAFKGEPETDDMRGSPTVKLIDKLREGHYNNIFVHDFVVNFDKLKEKGYIQVSLEEGFKDADCVLIGNNNKKYAYLDIDNYIKTMKENSLFFDIWSMFNPELIRKNGINYRGIGR